MAVQHFSLCVQNIARNTACECACRRCQDKTSGERPQCQNPIDPSSKDVSSIPFLPTQLLDPTLKQQISIWMCIKTLSDGFLDYQNDVNLMIEKYHDPTWHMDVHSHIFGWLLKLLKWSNTHDWKVSRSYTTHGCTFKRFSNGFSDY